MQRGKAEDDSSQPGIYVTADSKQGCDNSSCWFGGEQLPCATVSLAFQGVLQTSNISWHPWVYIEAGSYELSESVVFDVTEWPYLMDIGIVGQKGNFTFLPKPDVTISCSNSSESGFTFLGISGGVTIKNVCFDGCGSLQNSTSTSKHTFVLIHVALYFLSSESIAFQYVWVINSVSAGVVVYASNGTNTFTNCSFSYNGLLNSTSTGGGGAFNLEFPYCIPSEPLTACKDLNQSNVPVGYATEVSFQFESCLFAGNKATTLNLNSSTFVIPGGPKHMALGRGGGMSLYFKGNTSGCNVSISNSNFTNNTAVWGGGFFVEFQDTSHHNTLTVKGSHYEDNKSPYDILRNEGTGGGGVRADFILQGKSQPRNNHMTFSYSHFKNNVAYYGGGVSFFGGQENLTISPTNALCFIECLWEGNAARLGAAVDLTLWHYATNGAAVPVTFVNTTIKHHEVESNLQELGSLVGLGAMYIDSTPVIFEGGVVFEYNYHTALAVTNAQVEFHTGCSVAFLNNVGRYGGAVSLVGSAFFLLFPNTTFFFRNNRADVLGGAIFSSALGERNLISSRSCFIRYWDVDVEPYQWKVHFVFTNNSDSEGNISIYTSSLIPCVWGGEKGPYNPDDVGETFCWTNLWYYDHDCKDEIATTPVIFEENHYNATIIPGERKKLDIKMYDDLRARTKGILVLIATSENSTIATVDQIYISDNTLMLSGQPGNTIVSLHTQAPRVVYTHISVHVLPCPPGFLSANKSCLCKPDPSFSGKIKCSDENGNFSSQRLREEIWIGYYNVSGTVTYVAGESPFTFYSDLNDSQLQLDYSDIEGGQCGPQHRNGVLCAQCENGYCPAINSWAFDCVYADNKQKYGLLIYILTELFPLTIIFILLLLLNIRLTSGPANAFIFFSQTITATFQLYFVRSQRFQKVTKAWVVVYSVWNLRFHEIFPDYCLDGINNFASVIALEYATALLLLCLIAIFCLVASLYNRGIQPVLCLCRPVHYCVARLRVNTLQRTITDALAAFLLLSYTKFTIVSLRLLSPAPLYDYNGIQVDSVMYYDGTIRAFHSEHAPYIAMAIFSLLVVVVFPPLLLLLYPLKIFHKALSFFTCQHCQPGGRLELFLNAFYGCYKDGRDAGSYDYRYFAGLYFVFRVVFAVVNSTVGFNDLYAIQQILCTFRIFIICNISSIQRRFL